MLGPMLPVETPEWFNLADWLVDERLREGWGDRIALRPTSGERTGQ